ncbi:hypothetical protein O181_078417 [Austropuccinia psidii MF-1]|uniref:No apical meristem-associated C-terminal domain-containing protein n=1 Tax=Austropuccinia psidii MF-1 TaxID=1389203 RepID=A0A9Q3FHT3_9BASI|nr:hypothetical protein [Austropuccinia psidii MF-1]
MPCSKAQNINSDIKITSGLPHPSGHLICTDYLTIIKWLSVKSNFESCFGTSGSTSIGRPPSSKHHGFQLMAFEVNKKSQNFLNLCASRIRDQWQTYKKKYMAAKKFEKLTGAGITEEDESKGIKSMNEKLESMCPCYVEMDVLFGHKPNVTPIASYDSQEKDSFNGDDVDVLLDKENSPLDSPHNLDPFLNNDDNLVPEENLKDEAKSKSTMHSTQKCNQALMTNLNDKSGSRKRPMDMFSPMYANLLESRQKARETSENAHLEWDWERWIEEKASNMEKQWFEEVKLQKQMEFEEKKHAKKYEFEKEKWNQECELKEKQYQMDLTIAALSSSRPIAELERILKIINKR